MSEIYYGFVNLSEFETFLDNKKLINFELIMLHNQKIKIPTAWGLDKLFFIRNAHLMSFLGSGEGKIGGAGQLSSQSWHEQASSVFCEKGSVNPSAQE